MRNAGLGEAQAGIKIARRNINHLRYADDTTLMAESAILHQTASQRRQGNQWETVFIPSVTEGSQGVFPRLRLAALQASPCLHGLFGCLQQTGSK